MTLPNERRLRVLQVSAFFPSHGGGIEVVAGKLAQHLPSDTVQMHWMASGAESDQPPSGSGLTVEWVRAWDPLERRIGLPMPIWSLRGLMKLWRAVRACELVHVHDYLYQPSLSAIAFAVLLRRPWVITQHVGEIPYKSPWLRMLLNSLNRTLGRCTLTLADRVAFVGAPVMDHFKQFCRFERAPLLVPNGVDLEQFHPALRACRDASQLRLLFVGRFVEKKGLRLLLSCLDLPSAHWTFVGWGPLTPPTSERVAVLGRLPPDQIVPLYQQADLLVLPSTGEGFPLVVQEALACGTPVLVSKEVAGAFQIRSPNCVFEVDLACDDPGHALRHAISRLLQDPERLRAGRASARRLANQWSWDRCASAYRQMYESAAGARTGLRGDG